MSKAAAIQKLENKHLKTDITDFHVGDTIRVHTRIIEGEKERIQVFMGTVIARTGTGISETFSLHRVAYGEGMERVFMLHSPRIAKIEVVKEGKVRRAKLYYLRGTSGKKAKVKGRAVARRRTSEEKTPKGIEEKPVQEDQEKIKEEAAVAVAHEPVTEDVQNTTPSSETSASEQKGSESTSS